MRSDKRPLAHMLYMRWYHYMDIYIFKYFVTNILSYQYIIYDLVPLYWGIHLYSFKLMYKKVYWNVIYQRTDYYFEFISVVKHKFCEHKYTDEHNLFI